MRDRDRRRWGIAHVLVLLVLGVLAPFIVLEVYRGVQDVRRQREDVAQRVRAQADEEAETLDDFLRFTERFLATLAAAPGVQALDTAAAEALFHAARAQYANYENIFLVTTDGVQRASTLPSVSDPQVTERRYFRQALATGRMAISDVLAWRDTGRSAVVLAYPVSSADGTQRIGVIAIALNVARLSSVIGYVGLPDGSVVLLVQHDGTVIAASHDVQTWVGQTLAGVEVFAEAPSVGAGSETGAMPDGVERVVGSRPLLQAPWLVLAGIPEAEVDAAVRRSLLRVGQQVALAVLATALLAFILLRRVVVPIRVLSDGARAFASGFLNRRIPLRRRDELGELADALNTMAAALERRLEEEAAHARALRYLNRLQAEFVATASHELRTPVTAIRTYAEALLRPDILDEEARRECLEGIDRSSERLARLVRTLLDVSRIDSGQMTVRLGPVDAVTAARAAVGQAAPGAEAQSVTIDAAVGLPPVKADPDRLEDVLANLIGNARKFSPPGAPVTVRIRQIGHEFVIAVEDRGSGIPEAEMERVFDRFYQVDRGAGRRAGGSGLGLYIVRAYVEAMGGSIRVESAPGVGSTFTVVLPVAVEPAERRGEERDDAGVAGAARGG